MDVAVRNQVSLLERIKRTVKQAHEYFKPNYDTYNEFRRFVFESSLNEEEKTLLMTLSRPTLEFNILEAYISRLLGEFSKQEPDIMVNADDQNTADPMTIKLLEAHLRHTLNDAKNHHMRYEVYKDLLSGGFSVIKVSTDYANSMSFDQTINLDRVYDPTLCGFDQLARYTHKGDGRFCFELCPMSKEDFEDEYPDIAVDELNFSRAFAGFNWSYLNDSTKIILVCDFYEKKTKSVQIVKLVTGETIRMSEYNKRLKSYDGFMPPPGIVGKPRTTQLETIVRYRIIENQIISEEDTDFEHLPLVFVDGSSVLIKTPKNGNVRQVTRPYVYHAKGAQRLKNYAGITLANELENMVQHKFKVSKESLPKEEEFLQAYKDVQKASVLVYNEFYENNPEARITPPQEINRIPTPPEVVQAFVGADSLIQNILGSYDAQLGINDNQLSGVAIVEAASQSNAAAMPYIVGLLMGLQRCAEIYVSLMPKYITTPRTLPVQDQEGKRSYIKVNQQGGMNMFFDANALNVVVKAGASFTVQKTRTLMMVKELMSMSPLVQQFIAEKGINFLLDNMEGRGVEQLKQMVDQWTKEYEQQKQSAQQMQQAESKAKMAQVQAMTQKAQTDAMKVQLEAHGAANDQDVKLIDAKLRHDAQIAKTEAEKARAEADMVIKELDVRGRLQHDRIDMAHSHAKDISTHHLAVQKHEHEKRNQKNEQAKRNME